MNPNDIKINSIDASINESQQQSLQDELTDAHKEIADLKMQVAWLERSFE